MDFTTYIAKGAVQYALKGALFIAVLFYALVLAGIILQSPLGNKAYSVLILWQAGLWCLCLACIAVYERYCEQFERAPSLSILRLMQITLLGLTLIGFVLAELYAGLLQSTFSDLFKIIIG